MRRDEILKNVAKTLNFVRLKKYQQELIDLSGFLMGFMYFFSV